MLHRLLIAALVLSACGEGVLVGEGDRDADASDAPMPDSATTAFRDVNASCFARPAPPTRDRVVLEPAFTHLATTPETFRKLTHLVPDGDAWLASCLDGQVRAFSDASPDVRTVLDLSDMVAHANPEDGLVSIALHPDYAVNGYLFAVYMVPTGVGKRVWSTLGRFTRAPDGTFERASEKVILRIEQRNGTHHGNHIVFGRDGYLYYAVGDDYLNEVSNAQGQANVAQDPSSLKGKVLRLDVDREDPGLAYAIPADNPYLTTPGARPELYAMGFRNPWRIVFGPDDRLYLGDVGEFAREEIDVVLPGHNYGWPAFEGVLCHLPERCDDGGFTPPLVDYTAAMSHAIALGQFYDADAIAELTGRLVYADYVVGHIWSIDPDDPEPRLEVEGTFPIASFGRGPDGEVYALRYSAADDGRIYRLAPSADEGPSDFPRLLSETGCVDPDDPRTVIGAVPYAPIAELWSDGADKERFLAIPDDTQIAVMPDGDFVLPEGTVLIKHFGVDDVLHETRLFMREGGGWAGYSYRWDEAQTDAELLDTQLTATLPSGHLWTWPSRGQCLTCHTASAGYSLGLEVGQLGDTVHALYEAGFIAPVEGGAAALEARMPTLVDPFGDAPVEQRARSYLHANCANCHRGTGIGRADIDLHIATALADTRTCDVVPKTSRLWGTPWDNWADQLILRPEQPEASTLWLRMMTPGYFRMPPLASDRLHDEAIELIEAWIEGLTPCPTPSGQ